MPRVLTFEEMRRLHTNDWIWVEIKDYSTDYADCNCINGLYHLQLNRYVSSYHVYTDVECLIISVRLPTQTMLFDTYEKGWRIWSDKPTQEQMDNTGWDYSTWQGMHKCVDCALYVAEENVCDDGWSKLSVSNIDDYWICDSFRLVKE